MEIPYTVEVRPDTGLFNGKLGIWLFLASEVMLFGALFSSYILLRVGSTEWPRGYEELSVPLAFFNTIVLISSSVTMVMAWASLRLHDFGKFRLYLGATILLALTFLVVKYFEYKEKFEHHLVPGPHFDMSLPQAAQQQLFFSIYFMLTGIHAAHMIVGIVLMFVILVMAMRNRFSSAYYTPVEISGLYWHFVDIVWIFLFPLLYLLGAHLGAHGG